MRKPARSGPRPAGPKPPKHGDKSPATAGNRRLAEQTRKFLAKHYASKYRVK
jgi:hypothetical protein